MFRRLILGVMLLLTLALLGCGGEPTSNPSPPNDSNADQTKKDQPKKPRVPNSKPS
jgi:hypothetical protein